MTFRIIVEELVPHQLVSEPPEPVERYRQVVEHIDLLRLIEVVNTPPKPKRVRKAKATA
jgi:hypothetical protein